MEFQNGSVFQSENFQNGSEFQSGIFTWLMAPMHGLPYKLLPSLHLSKPDHAPSCIEQSYQSVFVTEHISEMSDSMQGRYRQL